MKYSLFVWLGLAFGLQSFAQDKTENVIDSRQPLRIDYNAPSWNKDLKKTESMKVILRDGKTNRMAQIQVNEDQANSGVFRGTYLVNWSDATEISPQLYVVPQSMTESADSLKKIDQLIQDGTLLRKPMFARKGRDNENLISIYDSREQATQAFANWQKSLPQGKKIIDPAALEASAQADRMTEQMRAMALAKKQQLDRDQAEERERLRREELKKQQSQLDEAEKARRRKQANELSAQALAAYQKNDFPKAESLFSKAVDLDPSNQGFYYQYGVTLYRNDKFDKSLIVLENANDPSVNKSEKTFFIGLNHMKLKEFDTAKKEFESLKNIEDKNMASSAAFFAGVIDFQKENFDSAKTNFEFTLDTSSDPKLDEQAESYIEQIANIMAFKAEQNKKFLFTFNLGLTHDSNILLVSNTQVDAGTSTNQTGYRWAYGGTAQYRPVYGVTHEFSANLAVNDMYSQDKNFATEATLQNADPLSVGLSLPYKYKGLAFGKGYQLGLTPSYETLYLNADGSGAREQILTSNVFKVDQTFVMNGDWFSTYTLEYRNDKSLTEVAVGSEAEASTANKITFSTNNTIFMDKKKTTAYIIEAGIANNQADGDNQKYNRYDLAGTYLMPSFWETSFTSRLGLYQSLYGSHLVGRTDTNTGLTLGLSKPLSAAWGISFNANYTINSSTLDANEYKKYSIGTALSWNGSL